MKITNSGPVFDPDDEIGDYKIIRPLGAGGMGQVYLARHQSIDDWLVAVKLMSGACDSSEIKERWRREAKSLIKLTETSHPNIVKILNAGTYKGTADVEMNVPYLVMEYVKGVSLSEKIDSGIEEPKIVNTLKIGRGIASGLAKIHENGIIHRDIKPANVLLDEKMVPKIVDFGIVALEGLMTLSLDDSIVGTFSYMAPERIKEGKDFPAGDIYSLGMILYNCISPKQEIFDCTEGGTTHFLNRLHNHIEKDRGAELDKLLGENNSAVSSALKSMLNKNPEQRPSAKEVCGTLGSLIEELESGSRTRSIKMLSPIDRIYVVCQRHSDIGMISKILGNYAFVRSDVYSNLKEMKKIDCLPDEPEKIILPKKRQTAMWIGRDNAADLLINHQEVSRKHAVLCQNEEAFELQDNYSSNGTFINGRKIIPDEPVTLNCEDLVKFGPSISYVFVPMKDLARLFIDSGETKVINRKIKTDDTKVVKPDTTKKDQIE